MNNDELIRFGECVVCMEERIDLYKWPNDACVHMFCQGCTAQIFAAHRMCPVCRRPPQLEQVIRLQQELDQEVLNDLDQRDLEYALNSIRCPRSFAQTVDVFLAMIRLGLVLLSRFVLHFFTILFFCLRALAYVLCAISNFVQNNSPFQWFFWFYIVFFFLVPLPVILCRSQDLPDILTYYDANNTILASVNISLVKQALNYAQIHTNLQGLCEILTK